MQDDKKPSDFDQLDADIQRLKEARQPKKSAVKQQTAMGKAMKIAVEMVASIIVGVIMGWGLDTWLGTSPWFFIGFFFLGAAAGIWTVVKQSMMMMQEEAGSGASSSDEDRQEK